MANEVLAGRGRRNQRSGVDSEALAAAALLADGWCIHATRLRTAAGEIDIVAEKDGLLAIVEVKRRATLADAAGAISPRQQARLLAAAEIVLGAHPDWGRTGMRLDVMLVDPAGTVRRIVDAIRLG